MSKVICVPMQEIMDTPGIWDALRVIDTRWTDRLRAMLADKGLDTSGDAQVYHMRVYDEQEWWFVNTGSAREGHDLFRKELALRAEDRRFGRHSNPKPVRN